MSVNRVEVVINGSILSIQGEATEQHMQKVAKIINEKIEEINKAYDKSHLSLGKLNQLLTLNLADECVSYGEKIESQTKALNKAESDKEEMAKKLVSLSAEMKKMQEELLALKQQKQVNVNRGR